MTLAGDMIRQATWSNLQLIDFVSGLPGDALEAAVPGTYGPVRNTLVHLVAALWRYHRSLAGGDTLGFEAMVYEALPWPGFAALRGAAETLGEAIADIADEMPAGTRVSGLYGERPFEMDASIAFAQVLQHCAEHRSQVAAALTVAGHQPPDFNAWDWGLATGRMSLG